MPRLTLPDYSKLTANAQILNLRRKSKPSIMLAPGNIIIKHLYRRGLWSSSTLKSYAYRFKKNSIKLEKAAITAPKITQRHYCPYYKCDLVIYPSLPGVNLTTLLTQHQFEALEAFPHFIMLLHQKGILFRDLHLENVLYHQGKFALIDIVSIHFSKKPLTLRERAKNLARMFCKEDQINFWYEERMNIFLKDYINAAGFDSSQEIGFMKYFNHLMFKNKIKLEQKLKGPNYL